MSHIGGPDVPTFIGETATPDPVTAALQGNVFDENDVPAAGVTVQVGSKTATTNSNGYFRINDASLDKKSAVVTATKTGYFKAYRTFGASDGANQVIIKLVKKALAGTVDAATGGEVTLSNGSKVALSAGGVVNAATAAAYSGTVNVYAAYVDPTASDITQTVPGSFMANDKDGKRMLLTSYGMVAIELESPAGAKLQVKSGSTAKLTTAIPSAVQGSAPASLPMWYVDETTGIWKEEGTAAKSGNVYVGDVKHFTYWNCDLPVPTITFTATLQTSGGQPLVNASVVIRPAGSTYGATAHGYTDSLGKITGPIPANMNLVLEVRQYGQGACNNAVIYSQNIGPFAQATNLGVITIPTTTADVFSVQGKLTTCSNTPVVAGYAAVSFGYYTHYARVNANGEFQTTFTRCSSGPTGVSIIGVDSTAQQQSSTPVSVTIATPVTNAGTISACGTSSSQFITYVLDGTTYNLVSPADSLTGYSPATQGTTATTTYINGLRMNNAATMINFSFPTPAPAAGSYNMSRLSVNNLDSNVITTPIVVALTNFPANSAGFYEGSFSGQFTNGGTTHTVSATFRVRRRM